MIMQLLSLPKIPLGIHDGLIGPDSKEKFFLEVQISGSPKELAIGSTEKHCSIALDALKGVQLISTDSLTGIPLTTVKQNFRAVCNSAQKQLDTLEG